MIFSTIQPATVTRGEYKGHTEMEYIMELSINVKRYKIHCHILVLERVKSIPRQQLRGNFIPTLLRTSSSSVLRHRSPNNPCRRNRAGKSFFTRLRADPIAIDTYILMG